MIQLPSAREYRIIHSGHLHHNPTLGQFWAISQEIYDDAEKGLPPIYCPGGFRTTDPVFSDLPPVYFKLRDTYWCGFTNDPAEMVEVLRNATPREITNMNIESKLFKLKHLNDGSIQIPHKDSNDIRVGPRSNLPSDLMLALMSEKQFDKLCREAFR